ncbi:MAG: hypothetical protein D6728_20310 [Cyanobacteria bacterium J055]|nr:MAG: hypothetical protein D6728_20310 [Cyanobacteria bacterium J055]
MRSLFQELLKLYPEATRYRARTAINFTPLDRRSVDLICNRSAIAISRSGYAFLAAFRITLSFPPNSPVAAYRLAVFVVECHCWVANPTFVNLSADRSQ